MRRVQQWGMVMMAGVWLSGCGSSSITVPIANSYVYNGIDFGAERDENFKQGVKDACRTADGYYTKDHALFNTDLSYKDGWEDGRLKCKGRA